MFGLQLVWSTEMAYASPYLLSLGEFMQRVIEEETAA
jgi:hypothetical protein